MTYASKQYPAPLAEQRAECRRMLAELLLQAGIDDPEPEIGHEPDGRPLLTNHPGLHISQSHCRTTVAVALSAEGPVGIDVESRRKVNPSLIARVCNPDEQRTIEAAADPEMEFLRLWTRKEAYLKYLGTGIQGFGSLVDTEAKAAEQGLDIVTETAENHCISICCRPWGDPGTSHTHPKHW